MANLRKEARQRMRYIFMAYVLAILKLQFLAHYRMAGICGTGMKPDDLIGAHGLVARVAIKSVESTNLYSHDNKDAELYHLPKA